MRGVDFMLLFFIIYDIIMTLVFLYLFLNEKIKNYKLDKYNEELNFELANLRRK